MSRRAYQRSTAAKATNGTASSTAISLVRIAKVKASANASARPIREGSRTYSMNSATVTNWDSVMKLSVSAWRDKPRPSVDVATSAVASSPFSGPNQRDAKAYTARMSARCDASERRDSAGSVVSVSPPHAALTATKPTRLGGGKMWARVSPR